MITSNFSVKLVAAAGIFAGILTAAPATQASPITRRDAAGLVSSTAECDEGKVSPDAVENIFAPFMRIRPSDATLPFQAKKRTRRGASFLSRRQKAGG